MTLTNVFNSNGLKILKIKNNVHDLISKKPDKQFIKILDESLAYKSH